MNTHTETNERWTFDEQHTRLRNYEPTQIQSEWWSLVGIGDEFALDVITPSCVSRERNVQIARLIAAAPDMYAMLKEVHHLLNQEILNGEEGWSPLVREIGQLLTKATEGAQ